MESMTLYREEINDYTTVEIPLDQNKFEKQICHLESSLCCDFKVELNFQQNSTGDVSYTFFKSLDIQNLQHFQDFYQYRAVVFQGIRDFQGETKGNITSCYITACLNETVSSCAIRFKDTSKVKDLTTFKSITISGNFKYGKNDLIFPNGVDTSIMPIHTKEFNYEEEEKGSNKRFIRFELKNDRSNLLSFGLFGRHFENSSVRLSTSIVLILVGIFLTILY